MPNNELISQLHDIAETNTENSRDENIPEGFEKGVETIMVSLNPEEWGYIPEEGETTKNMLIKEVNVPIEHEGIRYVIQTLTYDVPCEDLDKEELSIIVWAGGVADAYSAVNLLKRLSDSIEKGDFPYKVKLTAMPHLLGSARSENPDLTERTSRQIGAEVCEQVLRTPELEITKEVGIVGVSAGGPQALELAAKMGKDKVKFVALADPAGMAEHNVKKELVREVFPKAYKKYRRKGLSRVDSLRSALAEGRYGTPTSYGIAKNIPELVDIQYLRKEQDRITGQVGKRYGIEKPKNFLVDFDAIGSDSTSDARGKLEIPIIYQPIAGAEVVNALWVELKPTIEEEFGDREYDANDFMYDLTGAKNPKVIFKPETQKRVLELVDKKLAEFFPNDEADIKFSPFESTTHGAVTAPDESENYWDQLIAETEKVLKDRN